MGRLGINLGYFKLVRVKRNWTFSLKIKGNRKEWAWGLLRIIGLGIIEDRWPEN